MKVLHAPKNVAGQASTISRAQRALGIQSDVLVFDQNIFNFECDINLNLSRRSVISRHFTRFKSLLSCMLRYDVFHFHYGTSLLPLNLDIPILRLEGKRVLMHYWGSDIMQLDVALKYSAFDLETLGKIYPGLDDRRQRRKIKLLNKWTNRSVVGDYSLLPFSPDSVVVRQAVNLSNLPFVGCAQKHERINVVHAPTNRMIKGTRYIEAAVEKLRSEGHKLDFVIVEDTPHNKALEIFKDANIVIDDVLQGPYGIFAIECMALGKPVMCRIDDQIIGYYDELPIVNTPRDKVYDNLKKLIANPALREELGRKGRAYVEANHDSKVVARKLIELYSEL
jgi:glycosyltransferase involved in cell wall biosynthesis